MLSSYRIVRVYTVGRLTIAASGAPYAGRRRPTPIQRAENEPHEADGLRGALVQRLQAGEEVPGRAGTKQAASATGEGATAALMIREYLKGM